jgi:hypothetical protein
VPLRTDWPCTGIAGQAGSLCHPLSRSPLASSPPRGGTYSEGEQTNIDYTTREQIPEAIEEEWGSDYFDWIFEE